MLKLHTYVTYTTNTAQ